VAPQPVPQRELARALGSALGRPAFLPLPALVVKALFGRMGEEALLAGCFAVPRRLEGAGFAFTHPDLPGAIRAGLDA
jgi:NAD dependent epimerase/dehydratase family enzyme